MSTELEPLSIVKAIPPELRRGQEYPATYSVRLLLSRHMTEYEKAEVGRDEMSDLKAVDDDTVVLNGTTLIEVQALAANLAEEIELVEKNARKRQRSDDAKRAKMQELADSIRFEPRRYN